MGLWGLLEQGRVRAWSALLGGPTSLAVRWVALGLTVGTTFSYTWDRERRFPAQVLCLGCLARWADEPRRAMSRSWPDSRNDGSFTWDRERRFPARVH